MLTYQHQESLEFFFETETQYLALPDHKLTVFLLQLPESSDCKVYTATPG
jgi:hypothetical protein